MTVWMTIIEYIYIYATHMCKGLNTGRQQHVVNSLLYREHEMKTIIHIIITVHLYLCSAVRYKVVQTEGQGAE